jgi:hypothetical protein
MGTLPVNAYENRSIDLMAAAVAHDTRALQMDLQIVEL